MYPMGGGGTRAREPGREWGGKCTGSGKREEGGKRDCQSGGREEIGKRNIV